MCVASGGAWGLTCWVLVLLAAENSASRAQVTQRCLRVAVDEAGVSSLAVARAKAGRLAAAVGAQKCKEFVLIRTDQGRSVV